jgi:hypothetical protein
MPAGNPRAWMTERRVIRRCASSTQARITQQTLPGDRQRGWTSDQE